MVLCDYRTVKARPDRTTECFDALVGRRQALCHGDVKV